MDGLHFQPKVPSHTSMCRTALSFLLSHDQVKNSRLERNLTRRQESYDASHMRKATTIVPGALKDDAKTPANLFLFATLTSVINEQKYVVADTGCKTRQPGTCNRDSNIGGQKGSNGDRASRQGLVENARGLAACVDSSQKQCSSTQGWKEGQDAGILPCMFFKSAFSYVNAAKNLMQEKKKTAA